MQNERGKNERTSEDNANTYFQAAISNVHYLFYLYVAIAISMCMIYLSIHFRHELVVESHRFLFCSRVFRFARFRRRRRRRFYLQRDV